MGHVLKRVAVAAVPSLLVLTGCGVAGTDFNPGVAARVGDETITTDQVDELAASFCDAVDSQIAAEGQRLPLSGYKTGIAVQLALKSAAEQIADDYGVEASEDYKVALAQIREQAVDVDGSDREAFIEVTSTQPYYIDLLTQVGAIKLEEEGEEDPTIDFQTARGLDELGVFTEREGLEFDPRYGVQMVDGAPEPVDTDTSVAFSDFAKAGQADGDPGPDYVADLPLSATCG
jgi:hypothetical protein